MMHTIKRTAMHTIKRTVLSNRITLQTMAPFSNKTLPSTLQDKPPLPRFNWADVVERERRNVMKNYELILPGVYIRN